MDNKGKQAFRSGSTLALPPEELDETPPEQTEIDKEQEETNARYASLKGHPGWELIKNDFQDTISAYRSGRSVAAAIAKGATNEEVGALTRTSNAIADELEKTILTVEAAAAALEEEKPSGRPKQKRV